MVFGLFFCVFFVVVLSFWVFLVFVCFLGDFSLFLGSFEGGGVSF